MPLQKVPHQHSSGEIGFDLGKVVSRATGIISYSLLCIPFLLKKGKKEGRKEEKERKKARKKERQIKIKRKKQVDLCVFQSN